jgi:hypothetical protein
MPQQIPPVVVVVVVVVILIIGPSEIDICERLA